MARIGAAPPIRDRRASMRSDNISAAANYQAALSAAPRTTAKLGSVDEAAYDAMMARGRQEFDQGVFVQPVYRAFGRGA